MYDDSSSDDTHSVEELQVQPTKDTMSSMLPDAVGRRLDKDDVYDQLGNVKRVCHAELKIFDAGRSQCP